MAPLRILIADDHDVVRRGLKSLLVEQDGWEICGEASNGREAFELAQTLRPDVDVLDVTMPALGGLGEARPAGQLMPPTENMIHTLAETAGLVREVFLAGAGG